MPSRASLATAVCWILGALPLAIYPFVLLAGVMSLAAETRGDEPVLLMAVALVSIWGSLAYPLIYGGSIVIGLTLALFVGQERALLPASFVPLAYLAALALLFGCWMLIEQISHLQTAA